MEQFIKTLATEGDCTTTLKFIKLLNLIAEMFYFYA